MPLSKQNRNLIKEIDDIREVTFFNYSDINKYERKTVRLRVIKEQMIRGRVIMWHSWVDEVLDECLSNYFFYNHKRGGKGRISWHSKKYRRFKYYVLEKLSFRRKLELALQVKTGLLKYKNTIEKLDALRNILAHSFMPEKRSKKPRYKNKDIFSLDGISLLEIDMQQMNTQSSKLV